MSSLAARIKERMLARPTGANEYGGLLDQYALALAEAIEGEDIFDIRTYGAVAGGDAEKNSEALQEALTLADGARGRVVIPNAPVPFQCSERVELEPVAGGRHCKIEWRGVLDFRLATTIPSRGSCLEIGGYGDVLDGMTALPAIAANVAVNAQSIQFATQPALAPGDLFTIVNAGNMSWNPNLFDYRFYYHAGQYLRVRSVSSTAPWIVVVDSPVHDAYLTSQDIRCYRVQPNFVHIYGGGQLICPGLNLGGGGAGSDVGIHLYQCYQSTVKDLRVSGAHYSGLEVWRCFETALINVRATTQDILGNGSAGLFMLNSYDCWALGGTYQGSKHGISLTGAVTGSGPNRLCGAVGATIRGDLTAADMHGHCDRCGWYDCTIEGGVSLGGSNATLDGGSVRSAPDSFTVGGLRGICVRTREVRGGDFTVANVTCYVDHLSVQNGGDHPLALSAYEACTPTYIKVRNVTLIDSIGHAKLAWFEAAVTPAAPASGAPARVSPPLTEIDVQGLHAVRAPGSKAPVAVIQGTLITAFSRIEFNDVSGFSVQCDSAVRCPLQIYREVDARGSETYGVVAAVQAYSGVQQHIRVIDCTLEENDDAGLYVDGAAAANDVFVTLRGNSMINNGLDAASGDRTSLRADRIKQLLWENNDVGDTRSTQLQTSLAEFTDVTTILGGDNTDRGAPLPRLVGGVSPNDFERLHFSGFGSPEGVVTARPGATYTNYTGGAGVTTYVKETGTGNTGWVAK